MKQRAAEILFRQKLLILLPLLVILPLSVLAALRPQPQQWQSFSVIWVDQYRPLYQDDRLGWTPAINQAQLFNDFLHTRSFAQDVLRQTALAEELNDPDTEDAAIRMLWDAVRAWPTSNNFVTIAVTTGDPDLAHDVSRAAISSFQQSLRARTETQSKTALSLYGDRLAKADQALTKSRTDLAAYLAQHPELSRAPDSAIGVTQRDPTLARLSAQVAADNDAYNALQRRYDDLQASGAAGLEGQEFAFTVVDEPQRPLAPIPSSRMGLIKLPMIGLILGLMLSSGLAVALILTNRAVLGGHDIQAGLGVPVLGELPELRRRRWPWQRVPRDAVRLRLSAPARLITHDLGAR